MTTSLDKPTRPVVQFKPQPIAQPGVPLDPGVTKRAPPVTVLTDEMRDVIGLLVYGMPDDTTIDGVAIAAGWPLTLTQAARRLGLRTRRCREYAKAPSFIAETERVLKERRDGEKPRNLQRLILLRDNEGAGLAADRTVQIKAVAAIEGTDAKPSVSVQINNTNNATAISPGYVIRLPAEASAQPQQPAIKTIDVTGTLIDASQEQQDEGDGE